MEVLSLGPWSNSENVTRNALDLDGSASWSESTKEMQNGFMGNGLLESER